MLLLKPELYFTERAIWSQLFSLALLLLPNLTGANWGRLEIQKGHRID
jgi:hypothetical protein